MAPMANIQKVCVIGAGPGGLAAAKQKTFHIGIFEQQETVGGVWCATPELTVNENFSLPRTEPSLVPNKPVWEGDHFKFISPVYDILDTNIPHTLMNYSDQEFPKGSSLFPQHPVVREYLERYADDVLISRDIASKKETTSLFDAVVVANGHYDDPFIPDIPGLETFNKAHSNVISHSKLHRRSNDYNNKKVIVVGNSASGIDLSAQISTVSQHPLLISEKNGKSTSFIPPVDDSAATELVPEIEELIVEDRSARFKNGRVEKDIDSIVFCTGYMYSFPFLTSLEPKVVSSGERAQNLYQQIFYHPMPTLSFIGLPQRTVPFPVSESQAAVIARVLSGRLTLPSQADMRAWEDEQLVRKGAGKDFIRWLFHWMLNTSITSGKIPPYWGEEKQWIRESFPLIKVASRNLGSERHKVTSLEELGFDFGKSKVERALDVERPEAISRL
ncbi:hypothetical protein HYALB_00007983 [Hymenoscyphus albidus]|uniref:FAD/NAD(P)-binding domain-containing protein n=1 Tax=Hymenoscyphus albidus TaxID=595503 RepID=A0A9N9LFE4_9HELO|nr:hypothetical protein HYALB_00007983 [Hymenoscyphus albidus]